MARDAFTRSGLDKTQAYQAMEQAQRELPTHDYDDREALKEYSLGVVGYGVYATIKEMVAGTAGEEPPKSAAALALEAVDQAEGTGDVMRAWQDALSQSCILPLAELHFEFGKPEYEQLLREIVQGALRAAKELRTDYRAVIRLLFVFLMTICPHQNRPAAVAYLARTLAYEITLTKLSVGVAMKLSAYAIGEAVFLLAMQDALLGRTDGPFFQPNQLIGDATEGSWRACEMISPHSLVHLEDNGRYLLRGFADSEARLRQGMVKGTVERVLTLPVIGWVYRPMRWLVRVAYHKIKRQPLLQKLWDQLMKD